MFRYVHYVWATYAEHSTTFSKPVLYLTYLISGFWCIYQSRLDFERHGLLFRASLRRERRGVDEHIAGLEVAVDDGDAVVVEVAHAGGDPDGKLYRDGQKSGT